LSATAAKNIHKSHHAPTTTKNPKNHKQTTNQQLTTQNHDLILSTRIKGTQLQNTITTDHHPDGFTPIVGSRLKYPQPTVTSRSYNSRNPKRTTNQQLTTQNHNDLILSTRKGEGCKTLAHNNHIQPNTTHDDPYPASQFIQVSNHKPATPRNTITAHNPIPPPLTGNRKCIVCIRRKDDTDQQCQQKPRSLTPTASCTPSLITDTIAPLKKNPTPLTKCNPTQTTNESISSLSAFPCLLSIGSGVAHQLKSQLGNNSLTSLPIEGCSRLGTTGNQQPSDTKDDILPDLPSCNEALFSSLTTHTIRQNSIPYSRAYRYRTFCTTYGKPVKPGSIWHFRSSRHSLLQHSSEATETLQMQQVLLGASTNTKYIRTPSPTTAKPFTALRTYANDTNQQTLPTIYIREPGRPGPPWPPPTGATITHSHRFGKNFTVTRLSHHARPHPIYLPHPTAAMTRATLHTHDIRQYFIRSFWPQPQTAAKNLLRPP